MLKGKHYVNNSISCTVVWSIRLYSPRSTKSKDMHLIVTCKPNYVRTQKVGVFSMLKADIC